jgi:hypothetical protein
MYDQVVFQMFAPDKPLPAHFTLVGLLPHVALNVHRQMRTSDEFHAAHVTTERSLVFMESHVDVEIARMGEPFIAQFTLERCLACVGPHVIRQTVRLTERLATNRTHVGPLPTMCPHVCVERSILDEALGTNGALVGPLPCVDSFMYLEMLDSRKFLCATVTFERLFTGVPLHVLIQVTATAQKLTADVTLMRFFRFKTRRRFGVILLRLVTFDNNFRL